jgi:hypothetical protein
VGNLKPVLTRCAGIAFGRIRRITLTVNGADFSPNSIVRLNGADRPTIFMNDTQLLAKLTSADVASASSVVISVFTPTPGGGTSEFKTFTVFAPGALPIPSITQINTQGALAGSGPITIEIQGDNFAATAIVLFNGSPRPTTFVNNQLLRATLNADDVAQPGLGAITVQNSTLVNAPEATTQSSSLSINVVLPHYNPPPGITQISPASGRALDLIPISQIEVTITGNNFLPESRVLWNDVEYPTQYVNGTTLKLIVSAGDLAVPGVASVKVNNPAPGGGDSNVKTFAILDPIIPERVYLPLTLK